MFKQPLVMGFMDDAIVKAISAFFGKLFQSIMDFLHLSTFKYLIYGSDSTSKSKLAYNIFATNDIKNVVLPGMNITYAMAWVIFYYWYCHLGSKNGICCL